MLSPGIVYNPLVFPLVHQLLGGGDSEGINLLYAGIMWGEPQPTQAPQPQKWHADGGHCFEQHLPPHCINCFYNIMDVSSKHGPTEFVPGTHVHGKLNDPALNEINFSIAGSIGSCVLFDYRIKHRGGANVTKESRPVLYLCYARNWFRDSGNLRSARSVVRSVASPPWMSRILKGSAMSMGMGFDRRATAEKEKETAVTPPPMVVPSVAAVVAAAAAAPLTTTGSGERWVLFQMDVELGTQVETIVVYSNDVAAEVSCQFCLKHDLDSDVCVVLETSIQEQMNLATAQNQSDVSM